MSNELFGEVVKTISLDFAQKTSPVTVFAKQGDHRTRIIHIQPLMNGVPMNIDTSFQYVAKFAAKKPDGHYVYNDSAKINEDGTITVTLTDQSLAAHGNAICCVILETQSGDILTSQNFTLIIEFSAGAYQSLASSDEIMGLEDLIEQVKKLLDEFSGFTKGLPDVTEADNDKILMVIDGEWKLTYLPNVVPSTPTPSPTPTPTPTPTPSGYIAIRINSFSNGITGVKEYGEKITETTLSWSLSKPATKLTLDGEEIDAKETSRKITGLSITQDNYDKKWTLTATDERGAKFTSTTDPIDFANGIYYGVAEEPAQYDSAFILGLTKKLQDYKVTSISVNSGEGEYIYYCLPVRLGTCQFTLGQFPGGFELVSSIDFTNAKGYTEKYNIYKSDWDWYGQVTVKVS